MNEIEIAIPDSVWWNKQTPYFKEDFVERLKKDIVRWKDSIGDSSVDGMKECPRCGSPNYSRSRLSFSETQPRADSPHYYGKHCYTCGYSYDPMKYYKSVRE